MRFSHLLLSCVLCVALTGEARADESLQRLVNRLMRERAGAVIVSNPRTGEILAEWNREVAFKRAFPPGSTAKLVTCAVALEEGVVSPTDRIYCRRIPELLGKGYHCTHPPALEAFTLYSALANSCNYFFAALSARLRAETLQHGYILFGFGAAGSVKIPDDPAAKARAALGESPVLVTPAQLLQAYSAVATRGTVYRLWRRSNPIQAPSVERTIKLRPATWNTIADGLGECVRAGMGQAAAVKGARVAGKTGTANTRNGSKFTHAWFAGFGPKESAEIALVVFLERGTGARDAAPLAGRILREYFQSKDRE